jgi:hypothetical protein
MTRSGREGAGVLHVRGERAEVSRTEKGGKGE